MIFSIGFSSEEINEIREHLSDQEIFEVPEHCNEWKIEKIVSEAENLDGDGDWHDKKFILMHGIDDDKVKDVLDSIKLLGFREAIFATTTPTSLTWELSKAIDEWLREDEIHKKNDR